MKTAFMIYTPDREDGGMMGFKCALELPKKYTNTYEDAIAYLHPILSSPEFVKALIEEACLEDDLFQGYKFKFVSCGYQNYGLEYEFEYCGDVELDEDGLIPGSWEDLEPQQTFKVSMDFINIW